MIQMLFKQSTKNYKIVKILEYKCKLNIKK